jgi:hypothetical protein
VCKSVERIRMSADKHWIILNGMDEVYNPNEISEADGFDRLEDFWDFFEKAYRLPFEGVIIKW